MISRDSVFKKEILKEFHGSVYGGHFGQERTLKRPQTIFWWKRMVEEVKRFVEECGTCQQNKILNQKSQGLLVPLPIPKAVWEDVSMVFITRLPKVKNKTAILVVVDRLTNYCHIGALPIEYTAAGVAEFFMSNIIKLHGLP